MRCSIDRLPLTLTERHKQAKKKQKEIKAKEEKNQVSFGK